MDLLKNILIAETQKNTEREVRTSIELINKVYNDWKATGRRKNAIDLVSSSTNRISSISPSILPHIHDAGVMKLAFILMRCMDLASWKDISCKSRTYKRLFPLIDRLQHLDMQTGTGGTLRQVIMTRLSASLSYNDEDKLSVFVAYEPTIPKSYLNYLFLNDLPKKTVRMHALPLPESFDTLVGVLEINHKKAKGINK